MINNTQAVLNQIGVMLQKERDQCKQDVCMYCAGHAPQYETSVEGPNNAGNYVHVSLDGANLSLCAATSIFARERWLAGEALAHTKESK